MDDQQIPRPNIDAGRIGALIDWLIGGALPPAPLSAIVTEICEQLGAAGVRLDMLETGVMTLHPVVPGAHIIWRRKRPILEQAHSRDILRSEMFVNSPSDLVLRNGRTVRCRLREGEPMNDHPFVEHRRMRGYRDAIFFPLPQTTGERHVFAAFTKEEDGWTDAEFDALRQIQAPFARVLEAKTLATSTETLLSTYVGRGAGGRILNGQIEPGDIDEISAVIFFAHLKNFTKLSNEVPARQVIQTLNRFFATFEGSIREQRGEILKFVGDGILALFPTPDDYHAQKAAVRGALISIDTARETLNSLDDFPGFRAALHVGDVAYGNVGGRERLDFTAIGPTVNFAARLLSHASEIDADLVASDAVTRYIDDRKFEKQESSFKGFMGKHGLAIIAARNS
ncbi:MAG: adenylate/guanylate cyclase domain-containing protein [Alphaproteobacteria bacterium]